MNDPNCGLLKTGLQVLSSLVVIATISLIAVIGYHKKLEQNERNKPQRKKLKDKLIHFERNKRNESQRRNVEKKFVELVEKINKNVDDVIADDVLGERVTAADVVDDHKFDDVAGGLTSGSGDVKAEPTAPTRDVIYEGLDDENIYEDLQTIQPYYEK